MHFHQAQIHLKSFMLKCAIFSEVDTWPKIPNENFKKCELVVLTKVHQQNHSNCYMDSLVSFFPRVFEQVEIILLVNILLRFSSVFNSNIYLSPHPIHSLPIAL